MGIARYLRRGVRSAATSSGRAHLRVGRYSQEDMTVAADPDPYFALPSLFGAPAYARPPKAVLEAERPLDPDDLPIAAEQTDEERVLALTLQASGSYRLSGGLGPRRGRLRRAHGLEPIEGCQRRGRLERRCRRRR